MGDVQCIALGIAWHGLGGEKRKGEGELEVQIGGSGDVRSKRSRFVLCNARQCGIEKGFFFQGDIDFMCVCVCVYNGDF